MLALENGSASGGCVSSFLILCVFFSHFTHLLAFLPGTCVTIYEHYIAAENRAELDCIRINNDL